jgi:hypothetical protein
MSTNYRMNVIWSSQGAQLQRDINTFLGSFGQVDRQSQRSARNLSLWGQQMRALGTTLRYALAGAVVYSVATAVNSLGEFEAELGQIGALLSKFDSQGQFKGISLDLDKLGTSALQTSNKFGLAVDQVQQFQRAFVSSGSEFSGQRKEVDAFTKSMAELQVAAGGELDPLKMAASLSALIRGSGTRRPSTEAPKLTSELFEVLKKSPVLFGADISRDIGRLMAAKVASNMTTEQVLAVYGLASAKGGSPAVIGRGVTQLLAASLVNPKSKDQKAAFQEIVGTSDPTTLRNMGGFRVLTKLLNAAMKVPIGNASALRDDTLTDPEALAQAGAKGINLTLLNKAIGRQESVRQLLNLVSILQDTPGALDKFVKELQDAGKQTRITKEADIANQRRWYQQMRTAQQNLGVSLVRGAEPVLKPLAGLVSRISGGAVSHPEAALGVVGGLGAASLAAKLGLAGALAGRIRLPGRLGRIGGRALGAAGGPVLASEVGAGLGAFQATGMSAGPGVQGAGSRGNPFWVVVDPLSWYLPGAPSGTGGMGGAGVATRGGGGGLSGFLRRQGGRIAGGLGAGAAGAAGRAGFGALGLGALAAADVVAILSMAGDSEQRHSPLLLSRRQQHQYPFLSRLIGNIDKRKFSQGTREQLTKFATGDISAAHFERWLRVMALRNAQGKGQQVDIDGQAILKISIDVPDDVKRLLKISSPQGVPISLWTQGAPQHRGKNKSNRRVADKPRG